MSARFCCWIGLAAGRVKKRPDNRRNEPRPRRARSPRRATAGVSTQIVDFSLKGWSTSVVTRANCLGKASYVARPLYLCKCMKFHRLRLKTAPVSQVVDFERLKIGFYCRCKCLKFHSLRRKPRFFEACSTFKGLKFHSLRRNHCFFESFCELGNRNMPDSCYPGIYRKQHDCSEIGRIGLAYF